MNAIAPEADQPFEAEKWMASRHCPRGMKRCRWNGTEIFGSYAWCDHRRRKCYIARPIAGAMGLTHEYECWTVGVEETLQPILPEIFGRGRKPEHTSRRTGDKAQKLRPAECDEHVARDRTSALPALPNRTFDFAGAGCAIEDLHPVAAAGQGARKARKSLLRATQWLSRRAIAIEGDRVVDKDDVHDGRLIGPCHPIAKQPGPLRLLGTRGHEGLVSGSSALQLGGGVVRGAWQCRTDFMRSTRSGPV